MRGYWPRQADDTTGVTDHLNAVSRYVISGTLQDPEWENTTVLRGPLEDEVRALTAEPGKEIGITGSITVVHDLVAAGLVDEYRLFAYGRARPGDGGSSRPQPRAQSSNSATSSPSAPESSS